MKEKIVFKGDPYKVAKEIEETVHAYTFLCHLKGLEPTLENALMLKRQGW